jgi:8-oxo-dGTP pyrophosphatase MutT (NUDIX family)
MRAIAVVLGRMAYYFGYIVRALILNRHDRTRVIIRCDDSVLLVRSWLSKGDWELPGGGMHTGEDPAECARREVREELGINLAPEVLTCAGIRPYRSGIVHFNMYVFYADLPVRPTLKLQVIEIREAVWFTADEIASLAIHEQTRQLIEA